MDRQMDGQMGGRPRHKRLDFLGFLEHQEISRNFGDF